MTNGSMQGRKKKKKKQGMGGDFISWRTFNLRRSCGSLSVRIIFPSTPSHRLPPHRYCQQPSVRPPPLPPPPQALKESLTLHSHNHFRPGCLGRHLHRDSPATRCGPNQTAEQREFSGKEGGKEEGRTSTTVTQRSQTPRRDRSENMTDSERYIRG